MRNGRDRGVFMALMESAFGSPLQLCDGIRALASVTKEHKRVAKDFSGDPRM